MAFLATPSWIWWPIPARLSCRRPNNIGVDCHMDNRMGSSPGDLRQTISPSPLSQAGESVPKAFRPSLWGHWGLGEVQQPQESGRVFSTDISTERSAPKRPLRSLSPSIPPEVLLSLRWLCCHPKQPQGWWLLGKPFPAFGEEIVPDIQPNLPLVQLEAVSPCPGAWSFLKTCTNHTSWIFNFLEKSLIELEFLIFSHHSKTELISLMGFPGAPITSPHTLKKKFPSPAFFYWIFITTLLSGSIFNSTSAPKEQSPCPSPAPGIRGHFGVSASTQSTQDRCGSTSGNYSKHSPSLSLLPLQENQSFPKLLLTWNPRTTKPFPTPELFQVAIPPCAVPFLHSCRFPALLNSAAQHNNNTERLANKSHFWKRIHLWLFWFAFCFSGFDFSCFTLQFFFSISGG